MASNSKSNRRKVNPLSLAFLDVMFCGFGAVILIFLILDHASTVSTAAITPSLTAEINLLQEEVEEGQRGLAQIRNTLSDVSLEVVSAEGLASQILEQIDTFLQELAALENSSMATEEDAAQLRSDVRALEDEVLRMRASAQEREGNNAREILGDGTRQKLSGLSLSCLRTLILVDGSASMVDSNYANIIRLRLLSDDSKKRGVKWVRTVTAVDWISSQLEPASQYQIWTFNTGYASLIPGTEGSWLEVNDRPQLDDALQNLKNVVPTGGTNMEQLFKAANDISPPPECILLITDGLPTLGDGTKYSRGDGVSQDERVDLFNEAIRQIPRQVSLDVILMPLEGDKDAPGRIFQMLYRNSSSIVMPALDWPYISDSTGGRQSGGSDETELLEQYSSSRYIPRSSDEQRTDERVSFDRDI